MAQIVHCGMQCLAPHPAVAPLRTLAPVPRSWSPAWPCSPPRCSVLCCRSGLLRFVLKMPDSLVFGRILPALGLMMCLSTFYYAFLALPRDRRDGIVTLWDFCRAADDSVDAEGDPARAAAGLADGQNAALGGGEVTESLRCRRRS